MLTFGAFILFVSLQGSYRTTYGYHLAQMMDPHRAQQFMPPTNVFEARAQQQGAQNGIIAFVALGTCLICAAFRPSGSLSHDAPERTRASASIEASEAPPAS
jgi:hypothetical protein